MTRCHSYGKNSTCLVPMADNFNHNNIDVTNALMCLPLHAKGDEGENADKEYCQVTDFLTDHSQIYSANDWPNLDSEMTKNKNLSRGVFQVNIKQKSVDYMRDKLDKTCK